jgi:hypothetical protein
MQSVTPQRRSVTPKRGSVNLERGAPPLPTHQEVQRSVVGLSDDEIRDTFDMHDADGSGTLSWTETRQLVASMFDTPSLAASYVDGVFEICPNPPGRFIVAMDYLTVNIFLLRGFIWG